MNLSCEEKFQAQADRDRRRTQLFLKMVVCAVILIAAALIAPDKYLLWLGGPGVALVFIGLIIRFTTPVSAARTAESRRKTSIVFVRSAVPTACAVTK